MTDYIGASYGVKRHGGDASGQTSLRANLRAN